MKFLPMLHKKSASTSSTASSSQHDLLTSTTMPAEWRMQASEPSKSAAHGEEVRRRVARVMRWDGMRQTQTQDQYTTADLAMRRRRKCPQCFQIYDTSSGHRHPMDAVARHQATEALTMLASDRIMPRCRSSSLQSDDTLVSEGEEESWRREKRRSKFVEMMEDELEGEAAVQGEVVRIYLARDGPHQSVCEADKAMVWHLNGERMFF
ncbi:hypothetical protein BCR37DRAFT_375594 [Protomyces lactucae-debilis]|uniref:Uncharacterized protein n=1 Tax=Protomyces lactucae-debilis TaxID=2754530 RepID=A0A1Y2FUP1_PROLT|nr:uncharacterized protein BCR37DRAFT_375594 [Protomyces lactucae-debilis]ORY87712.1 hypothetical protein BCR37DRAFT_375594 [Protomyces lactucae-debilis]